MKYRRLPILIAIGITCLGFTPNKTYQLPASAVERVAQATSTETSPNSSGTNADAAYDRYMGEGYAATNNKDYKNALESFKKAQKERPEDPFAQQAIQNVQNYIDRENFRTNLLWLFLGFIALTIGMGIAFFLFFRSRRLTPQLQEEGQGEFANEEFEPSSPENWESEPLLLEENQELTHQQATVKTDHKSFGEANSKKETNSPKDVVSETSLVVQPTTRLPNLDLIEELIKNLRDTDPKKRRKAIWELAQKSDSRGMKPLVDLMIDTDSQERSLILEALSQISTRTLKPMNQALAISLQDKNPQVRKNAIRDLTRIYDVMSQISQLLCHTIDDSDLEVQETAKWVLNQLNLQMVPRLDLISKPENPSVSVEQSYTESAEL